MRATSFTRELGEIEEVNSCKKFPPVGFCRVFHLSHPSHCLRGVTRGLHFYLKYIVTKESYMSEVRTARTTRTYCNSLSSISNDELKSLKSAYGSKAMRPFLPSPPPLRPLKPVGILF